jgi:hypothetical protein
MPANEYFWRNYIGAEVDYVQIQNDMTRVYEFKWSSKRRVKIPKAFVDGFGSPEFTVINQKNAVELLNQ